MPVTAPVADIQSDKAPITGISLIRDFGPGMGRGHTYGHYSQQDVIDGYAARLADELEDGNVRTSHVDTRKTSGKVLSWEARLLAVPSNFVPVLLACDYHDRARLHNASVVEFSGAGYLGLATAICSSLSDWGRCYVWGHRVSKPVVVNGAPRPYVCIKPFAVNGPHAEEYLLRLDRLGESIGRAICGYLIERDQGRTRRRR